MKQYTSVSARGETTIGKARGFSPEVKAQVVLEIVSGRKSLALASREYQINSTVLSRPKAPEIFDTGRPAEQKRLRERIADLERLASTQAPQLEIAKEASRYLKFQPPENESYCER